MTKQKPKKACEFEAMRDVADLLAPFSTAERTRIVEVVLAKLVDVPQPAKRGRKPKANGAHQSGGPENGLITHGVAMDLTR